MKSLLSLLMGSGLFRATMVYGAVSAVNRAIPFLLIPVFTRYLTTRDYGLLSMFGAVLSILLALHGFGVLSTVSLRYFQRDRVDLAVYVGNCFYVLASSTLLLGATLSLFGAQIESATGLSRSWTALALLIATASFFGTTLLQLLQASGQPLRFGMFQVMQTVVNLSISLLLVVQVGMGWDGRVYAQVAVALLSAAIALYALRRSGWLRFAYNPDYVRDAVRVGAPLLPHALAGFVMDATDRLLINNMVNTEETGLYAVGAQLGMAMLMLTSSFNMAWVPWLFSKLNEPGGRWKRRIVLVTYAYDACVLLIALAMGALAPFIFELFVAPSFASGSRFVIWVALGYAFNGMYMMVTNYLVYAERTALVAWATLSAAIINVVASYLLIRVNGAIGAAQGAMIAHFCAFILTWILAARIFPMPWSLRVRGGDDALENGARGD